MALDYNKGLHAWTLAREYGLVDIADLKYDAFYTDYPFWWIKLASRHQGFSVLVKYNPDDFT